MKSTDPPTVMGYHEAVHFFVKPSAYKVNNSFVFCSLTPPVTTPLVRQTQQFSRQFTRAGICPQTLGGQRGCWKCTNSIKSPCGIMCRTRGSLPLVYSVSRCVWAAATFVCACMCGFVSTLREEDIDNLLTGCWLSSLREDEACPDVGWESPRRGVMRQSDGEAAGERRACVRAEDGDNKLSPSTDTNTPLSGWDYLQRRSKLRHRSRGRGKTCVSRSYGLPGSVCVRCNSEVRWGPYSSWAR